MRSRTCVLALLTAALALPGAAAEYEILEGHGGPVMAIDVSPDGRIATGSFDNALGLWDQRDAPVWLDGHDAAVTAVAFWDETRLVSGSDDFRVLLWDSGTLVGPIGSHQGKIAALATSPAAGLVASASWDGTIGLWTLAGEEAGRLTGHDQGVNDIAFSEDGTALYSASSDGTVRVWDVATGAETRVLVENGLGINRLLLDPDAGWLAYGTVDGATRIVDLDTGAAIRDLSLERRPILALALSPDGNRLAVGDGEGYIMIVMTADWRIERDFRAAPHGPIWALAFSRDGENVLAAGLDDRAHSWPIADMDAYGQMDTADRSFLADPDLLPNGERQFKRKCSICHTLTPGSARRAGPSLYGLFGRQVGTVADYTYSDALTGSDLVWTEETVDALFSIGPEHYLPGTKMPMQRITGAEDRADLIAYLRRETAPEEDKK